MDFFEIDRRVFRLDPDELFLLEMLLMKPRGALVLGHAGVPSPCDDQIEAVFVQAL